MTSLPERWLVLTLRPPARGEAILLVDALHRVGARLIDREGERVVAYVPPPDDVDDFLAHVAAVIRSSTTLEDLCLDWRWETAEGWEARWHREVAERRVSERIVVTPAGPGGPARQKVGAGAARGVPVVVRLRPGLAFGTAEHPTTRGCLRLLDRRLASDARGGKGESAGPAPLLDMGTGSGILAIAAALLGAPRVLALEADAHACRTARENVTVNGVERRVEVREMRASAADLAAMGPFGGIMANVPPPYFLPLLPGLVRALAPGGWLMASGVPRDERDALLRSLRGHGLGVDDAVDEEEWWSAVLVR